MNIYLCEFHTNERNVPFRATRKILVQIYFNSHVNTQVYPGIGMKVKINVRRLTWKIREVQVRLLAL